MSTHHAMSRTAIAIFAHPDDIEFVAAGTLLRLREAGWETHYLNVSSGNLGSVSHGADETRALRAAESRRAADILGAVYHPPVGDDLEILYTVPLLRRVAAIVRQVRPSVVLTHSPDDYMEDHQNTARLAVTAAFSRGMPNLGTDPPRAPGDQDVAVYHAMPHGLRDPLRRRVLAGAFVGTTEVHGTKREALASHASQKEWLDVSQGMDSYLASMDAMSRQVGRMSGCFEHAEGWRRRLHLGFGPENFDPLTEALGEYHRVNPDYEAEREIPV